MCNELHPSTEEFDVDVLKQLAEVPSMEGLALSGEVSVDEAYTNEIKDGHGALLDLGLKRSIAQCLADRGCDIRVFPRDSKARRSACLNPDGIMLSNSPGDPGLCQT